MWARFVDGCVIGPYLLPSNLTSDEYFIFHEYTLHGLLEDVHQNMLFQHDSAPPHFTLAVWDHLDQRFGQNWIGRGGPIGSPDLTTLDYFLWSHMKSSIYEIPVESEEDLLAKVMIWQMLHYQVLAIVYSRIWYVELCMCWSHWSSHQALLVSGPRRKTGYSKQQKWESSMSAVVVFCL